MAKIKFFTDTMMVISSLKTETIKKHHKYGDKLILTDEKENELFRIDYTENGRESLTKYGAVYNTTTSDGYAAMTIKDKENFSKEKITIKYGEAINMLNSFENMIKNSKTLDEKIKNVEKSIEEVTFFNDNTEYDEDLPCCCPETTSDENPETSDEASENNTEEQ